MSHSATLSMPRGTDAATLESSTLRRVRFLHNQAQYGGGLSFHRGTRDNLVHHILLEDVLFQGNEAAESGGGIQVRGGFRLSFSNVTFRDNRAMQNGGAISIRLIEASPAVIEMYDTIIESSHADSHGGAIHCSEVSGESVSLDMKRVRFMRSSAYGNGGAIFYGCQSLKITNSSFQSSSAFGGNGGALHLGRELECRDEDGMKEVVSFRDVQFYDNTAKMGAVAFFDAELPTCAIPYLEGSPNVFVASKPSVWSWEDFNTSVSGNAAVLGNLQATTPVNIKLFCAGTSALLVEPSPGPILCVKLVLQKQA